MTCTRDWLAVACIMAFCIYLFLTVWEETGIEFRQQIKSGRLDAQQRVPMLGIVVPLCAEEMNRGLESLSRWPTRCSGNTVNSVDVILYFAGEVPQEFESALRAANDPSSCFRRTRVVSAALSPEETSVQVMRSAQFYNIFLAPDVRSSFVDYDALAIMDWDTTVVQETSFDMLYSATFTASEPFWVKGSRLPGTEFDGNAALPENWHLLEYLDGNAIYNNTDREFIEFVNFTLNRWHFTRPYDAALWATISDYPYSWPLWQRYASKFVVSDLMSTVEIGDMEEATIDGSVPGALFLRGHANSAEGRSGLVRRHSRRCHEACGSMVELMGDSSISTVCDTRCVDNHSWMGLQFRDHDCGAGDSSKYGDSCRLCFLDQQAALDADKMLDTSNGNSRTPHVHVIMCETKRPPEAIDCPRKCEDNANTVCDDRCGKGWYGDWHCNWRDLGEKCRFCFRDVTAAQRADIIARESGGRVIMCETHEPPPEKRDMEKNAGIPKMMHDDTVELRSAMSTLSEGGNPKKTPSGMNPAETPFIGDITRGNICVFIPGFFEFFHETRHAVDTVLHFMPGLRVVIATHPTEYHVFQRFLGVTNVDVSIVNDTQVVYAPLAADEACGKNVRLIYYMGPGEVLSRPFTAKDTHSPKGDLLVTHTNVDIASGEHARRSMGITALLGFHGLSLTYGTDLILPAEINAELRAVLRAAMDESFSTEKSENCLQVGNFGTCEFHEFLNSMSRNHLTYASIFLPELLAALLYSRSPRGVQFVDSRDRGHHFSRDSMIWDVPLVKPRFGCSLDLSLTLQGYDIAHQLGKHVDAFRSGAQCERGFVAVDPESLKLKAEWEFPIGYPSSRMPGLQKFRISVMYRTFSGDAELLKISLPKAIKNIPDALEIVVVVEEMDKDLFEQVLAQHRESAPFPLRVVSEPSLMNGHIQQKYSKLRADLYTKGDYILHLDSDVLVLHEIAYDDIFHLGKPVLPFRRYRDDSREGVGLISCWKNGTSQAIGEDVVHEFSIFNTHVYPRQMYPALRQFLEGRHGKPFGEFMSQHIGRCSSPDIVAKWTAGKLLSDFNLMGAFLWYHMHDAVYWLPADPYDLRPDQWRTDILKYQWVCQANGRSLPSDAAGKAQFRDDFLRVTSTQQCNFVVQHWRNSRMANPQTRTTIPWAECHCGWN